MTTMSAAPDPFEIIGALADEARLRVLAALVLGARTTDDVAARAGLAKRETLRALSRLAALGLVEPAGSAWDVRADRLRAAAAAAREKPARLDYLEATSEEAGVLRRHLIDEGLLSRASGEYWRTGGTVVI